MVRIATFRTSIMLLLILVGLAPVLLAMLFNMPIMAILWLVLPLLALAVIVVSYMTKPVSLTMRQLKKVAATDSHIKMQLKTKDEFSDLADIFNIMISHVQDTEAELKKKGAELQRSHHDMKKLKEGLEKKIKDLKVSRTAMLNIMEDINAANEELKSLDKTKDEFLSIVSHELKTPITPIKTYTEMLIDGDLGKVTNKQKECLFVVTRNVARLKMLIDDLLDVTRLDTGKMKFVMVKTDLSGVIREVMAERAEDAKEKKISLSADISKVPRSLMDPKRMKQVISNLVDNAIKFTASGGKISVELKRSGPKAVVSVRDNGIGISKESLPRIFEKFYQVDSSLSRRYGGTGLGLRICKGIVELMGGRIWVDSELGKGTTVNFSLPINKKNDKR